MARRDGRDGRRVGIAQTLDPPREVQSDARERVDDGAMITIQRERHDARHAFEIGLHALVKLLDDLMQLLTPFAHRADDRKDEDVRAVA